MQSLQPSALYNRKGNGRPYLTIPESVLDMSTKKVQRARLGPARFLEPTENKHELFDALIGTLTFTLLYIVVHGAFFLYLWLWVNPWAFAWPLPPPFWPTRDPNEPTKVGIVGFNIRRFSRLTNPTTKMMDSVASWYHIIIVIILARASPTLSQRHTYMQREIGMANRRVIEEKIR